MRWDSTRAIPFYLALSRPVEDHGLNVQANQFSNVGGVSDADAKGASNSIRAILAKSVNSIGVGDASYIRPAA